MTRSKNIVSVLNFLPGRYCITLASSIDGTTTVPVVSLDLNQDDTDVGYNSSQAFAEFDSDENGCADPGKLEIVTGRRTGTSEDSPDGDVHAVDNTLADEAFTIVIR